MSIVTISRSGDKQNPSRGPWGPGMNALAREAIEHRPIAVLRDTSQGWGGALTLEETMATIVRWTRAALGRRASVRLLLPNKAGHLRVGHPSTVEGSSWRGRREAFVTQRPVLRRPRNDGTLVLALPLVCGGASVGVLEVQGPPEEIHSRRIALENIGKQAATLLDDAQRRNPTERDLEAEKVTELLTLGVALTAHELRGPVSGAKAVIEDVAGDPSLDAEHRRKLDHASQELRYLYELAEEALRWFLGDVAPPRDPVDLVRVARDAAESSSVEAGEQRTVVFSCGPVIVLGDHNQLRAALSNIVRNALLYSPRESRVEISVARKGQRATIAVKDNGPGIARDERRAIFEPFLRGSAAEAAPTGKGLGLFLARSAIESHDGLLQVECKGSGSTFHISLPIADLERGLWHDL
jgi:signal transduction histidine kinase